MKSKQNDLNMTYIWMISLTAACGGFLFGYDWAVIGGAKPFYEAFFAVSDPVSYTHLTLPTILRV